MATEQQQTSPLGNVQVRERGDLSTLLNKEFRPRTPDAEQAVQDAVRTLAVQALSDTNLIKDDVVQSIERIIKALDDKLTKQINLIIHHAEFQQMEGAWRGLRYLDDNTETDENLKIKVLNISKKDLSKSFAKF